MTTRAIEAAFPLTPLQEGMLYHTIRDPASALFHVQCDAVLEGTLLPEHFEHAWALAAQRHAVMHTFFSWEGRERPLQVVRAATSFEVTTHDWVQLAEGEQGARWQELLQRDRERGFELTVAPLMRVTLARVATGRHLLLWSMHHALMDGWSTLVVLDEVLRDHAALAAGTAVERPSAPRFDRFVGWLEGRDRVRDEAFWRRALEGFQGPVALPGGMRSRRPSGDRVGTRLVLSAEETRQVQAAAARSRVTVNTLLMGAWAVTLARHAGRDDVLFGATVSERPAEIAGVERAAGLYLSTVPVRAPAQRGAAVGEWLRALQVALSEAREHGAPGLSAIQRWSGLASAERLFDSLVVFESFPEEAVRPFAGGLPDDDAERPARGSLALSRASMRVPNDVPLVLLALPGERLVLEVVHEPAAVPAAIAARLPSHLAALLAEFGGDSARPVDDLDLLGADERRQLIEERSGARVPTPPPTDVLERFERHAADRPEAIALRTAEASLSYGELDRLANRLANRLAAAGIGPETFVGILAERSVEAIAAMLASLKAGAAFVPLDPSAPDARVRRITGALDAVFAAPSLAPRLSEGVRVLALDDASSLSDSFVPRAHPASSAAYVVFTSGSTGEPKGVVVERGQLAVSNGARDAYYAHQPGSFLLLSPLAVDSAFTGIFWTLGSGGTLVLPGARAEQDVDGLTSLIQRAGVTHTLLVPSLYRTLLDHAHIAALASLRCVIVAGEACPVDVVIRHRRLLPLAALHNEYGPSEATVWATAGELASGRGGESPSEPPSGAPVTIGRPIPGTLVYLLDESLRPVPGGSVGEICIGGAGVARGYLGMPDETARRFVADPFRPGGRVYRSGDRGRFLPDGRIEFLGRDDEQLKVRGFRVELGEIERALGDYPGVREAAVALVRTSHPSDDDALVTALLALPVDEAERLLRDAEAVA